MKKLIGLISMYFLLLFGIDVRADGMKMIHPDQNRLPSGLILQEEPMEVREVKNHGKALWYHKPFYFNDDYVSGHYHYEDGFPWNCPVPDPSNFDGYVYKYGQTYYFYTKDYYQNDSFDNYPYNNWYYKNNWKHHHNHHPSKKGVKVDFGDVKLFFGK